MRRAIALVIVLAASCGGDGASALGPGDYFTQLARISENARIQERGLERERRVRLERAAPQEQLQVMEVYVGQSVRLYQDVVDALTALEPADGFDAAHASYLAAWQTQLDLLVKVRDAGFDGVQEYVEALEAAPFDDARSQTHERCEALQAAVSAAGEDVDLACGGRSS